MPPNFNLFHTISALTEGKMLQPIIVKNGTEEIVLNLTNTGRVKFENVMFKLN